MDWFLAEIPISNNLLNYITSWNNFQVIEMAAALVLHFVWLAFLHLYGGHYLLCTNTIGIDSLILS